MRTSKPKAELVSSSQERLQLESFARNCSLPAASSRRAQIALAGAAGEANKNIAARLALTQHTVSKFRTRLIERRSAGLYDDMRFGPPRSIEKRRATSSAWIRISRTRR